MLTIIIIRINKLADNATAQPIILRINHFRPRVNITNSVRYNVSLFIQQYAHQQEKTELSPNGLG